MPRSLLPFIPCRLFSPLLLGALALGLSACEKAVPEEKELLVYCGITMIEPMTEIARIIEKEQNCRIVLIKDGSGNLLRSIRANMVGDLFLPGSEGYLVTAREEGLVAESVPVGFNKAALMVQKGNPKRITADLENLTKGDYYVVIGNANSGSIGRETKKILEKKGIYERVLENAKRLTTDSKDLTVVLKNGEADLVINWYATAVWPENRPHIDVLPIDEAYAEKKKLVLGLLATSRHPQIARRFMELAASEEGRRIFDRHGFYHVP